VLGNLLRGIEISCERSSEGVGGLMSSLFPPFIRLNVPVTDPITPCAVELPELSNSWSYVALTLSEISRPPETVLA